MNEKVSNPNDFKVVELTNSTDFDFTPELGCMYAGNPIFGASGAGIMAGESKTLPYHVGNLLARNLAKQVKVKEAPVKDKDGIPTGVPLWDDQVINNLKNSFLTELYTENKPLVQTETQRLMAKIDELEKFVKGDKIAVADVKSEVLEDVKTVGYQDKAEVMAQLDKRQVKYDKRQNKATLEKLLA